MQLDNATATQTTDTGNSPVEIRNANRNPHQQSRQIAQGDAIDETRPLEVLRPNLGSLNVLLCPCRRRRLGAAEKLRFIFLRESIDFVRKGLQTERP